MHIHRLTNQATNKTGSIEQDVRRGQIMQGKVLELYPGQRATIQFGAHKWHAQMKTGLIKGEYYNFRIEQTGDPLVLKVVGESLGHQSRQNAAALLEQLGFASTKARTGFLSALLKEHIPFGQEELAHSFKLLEGSGNNKEVQTALKYMLNARLPLNTSVLEAIQMKASSTLAQTIHSLSQELGQERQALPRMLADRLQWLSNPQSLSPSQVLRQVIQEVSQGNTQFFRILQTAGAVDTTVDFKVWQDQWMTAMERSYNQNPVSSLFSGHTSKPFSFNAEYAAAALRELHPSATSSAINGNILSTWSEVMLKGDILPDKMFNRLQADVQKIMSYVLPDQQKQLTTHLTNQGEALKSLHTLMENMSVPLDQNSSLSLQNRFLAHVETMLQYSGLSHEVSVARHPAEVETSIKSLLIQLIQQQDNTSGKAQLSLLHLLNGLQIDAAQETNYMIQAALQLPGEKIGLKDDVLMELTGRKRKNGTIDPDDCSILFHLNLTNLNETLIDMHIQKRTVALTIWNESVVEEHMATALKPMLKSGLQALDYKLTQVTFKQRTERTVKTQDAHHYNRADRLYEGVDFRI